MTNPIPLPVPAGPRDRDRIQAARDNHNRLMAAIATRFDPRIEGADSQLNQASGQWEVIYGEENRFPSYSSPLFYWPFMTVLAICEAPVNRLSFELFFAESPLISLGVSLLVGAVLMILAHVTGTVSRRFGYSTKRHGGMWVSLGQLAVTLLLIGALCYGVAVLRQGYLAFLTRPDPSFSALIDNQQLGQAAMLVLSTALALEGWIFLFINLGIVAVGTLAAYFCHDPHPVYELLDRRKKKAQKQLDALRAQRADAEAAEKRRVAAQLQRLGA